MLVNGTTLVPHQSGALFWPEQSLLMVADLHLEKGSSRAARGHFLPPYDTAATLRRLAAVVMALDPATVACLGDSFHDPHAEARLSAGDRLSIQRLTQSREWLWIGGNHDPQPPTRLGGNGVVELKLGPLTLRHRAAGGEAGEIAGHLHPKASVRLRGRRLTRRCFISDNLRAVLPAFGAYAGGLDVGDPAFGPLFPGAFKVYLLGQEGVHVFPSRRLVPLAPEHPR
ncbi:MAG: ligase-associated DNA damage response endonuclease PdeM [Proteobacteria bacterium]|nr:ligase-associated DNA damage response endonuclease PdeM [Pseudomonadota bacterium]